MYYATTPKPFYNLIVNGWKLMWHALSKTWYLWIILSLIWLSAPIYLISKLAYRVTTASSLSLQSASLPSSNINLPLEANLFSPTTNQSSQPTRPTTTSAQSTPTTHFHKERINRDSTAKTSTTAQANNATTMVIERVGSKQNLVAEETTTEEKSSYAIPPQAFPITPDHAAKLQRQHQLLAILKPILIDAVPEIIAVIIFCFIASTYSFALLLSRTHDVGLDIPTPLSTALKTSIVKMLKMVGCSIVIFILAAFVVIVLLLFTHLLGKLSTLLAVLVNIGFFIGIIYVFLALCLPLPLIATDNSGIFFSIIESFQLIWGKWWHSWATLFLPAFVASIIVNILNKIIDIFSAHSTSSLHLSAAGLLSIALAVLYYFFWNLFLIGLILTLLNDLKLRFQSKITTSNPSTPAQPSALA